MLFVRQGLGRRPTTAGGVTDAETKLGWAVLSASARPAATAPAAERSPSRIWAAPALEAGRTAARGSTARRPGEAETDRTVGQSWRLARRAWRCCAPVAWKAEAQAHSAASVMIRRAIEHRVSRGKHAVRSSVENKRSFPESGCRVGRWQHGWCAGCSPLAVAHGGIVGFWEVVHFRSFRPDLAWGSFRSFRPPE